MTTLQAPENHSVQSIHTEEQKSFLRMDRNNEASFQFDYLNLKRQGSDNTHPKKIEFSWETSQAISYFELSETKDFTDAVKIQTEESHLSIGNLKIAQRNH